jgi:hypothetical protein
MFLLTVRKYYFLIILHFVNEYQILKMMCTTELKSLIYTGRCIDGEQAEAIGVFQPNLNLR